MSNHLHRHLLSLIVFFVQHSVAILSLSYFSVFVKDCIPEEGTQGPVFLFLSKTIPEEGPQGPKRCVRYECFVPVKTDGTTLCEFPLL